MKLKLPSFSMLFRGAAGTFLRFPVPIIASVIACYIAVYFVEAGYDEKRANEFLWKILMSSGLCLTLGIGLKFFSESRHHNHLTTLLLQLTGVAIGALFYFFTPDFRDYTITTGFRYGLFVLAAHLFVAIAPFIGRGSTNGFWRYNEALFLRFLISAFFSAVLYVGLAVALLSVVHLFDLKDEIREEKYADLWFIIAIVFHTWLFLSGVPDDLDKLEEDQSYPKGLKIFTQFVLLPLVTIYLLILYAYYAKIIMQWELPRGWVGWLVMSFSVTGILSLLLVFPIRNSEENKWIRNFSRFYYIALLPLVILLCLAIYYRVSEYAITEPRYFLIVLTLWLGAVSLYFLFSKRQNIKIIPVSLLLIALLSAFGPWGAFSVSEKSQVKRLKVLLEKNDRLSGDQWHHSTDTIPTRDLKEINSIITYLGEHHDFENFASSITLDLDSMRLAFYKDKANADYPYTRYRAEQDIRDALNIETWGYNRYDDNYPLEDENGNVGAYFSFYNSGYADNAKALSTKGYDFIAHYSYNSPDLSRTILIDSTEFLILFHENKNEFDFGRFSDKRLTIALLPYMKRLNRAISNIKAYSTNSEIPDSLSVLTGENEYLKIAVHFQQLNGTQWPDSLKVNWMQADILIKFKDNAGAN